MREIGTRLRHAIGSGDYDEATATPMTPAEAMSTPAASSGGMSGSGTITGTSGRELPAFRGSGPAAGMAENLNSWAEGDLSFLDGKM